MEVLTYNSILKSIPTNRVDLPDGSSRSWNLLVGTNSPVPLVTDGEKVGEYTYTIEDLIQIRDNLEKNTLGILPSIFQGHEFRHSGTPALGTVVELCIVDNGIGFDLYFETIWTPQAKSKIDTGEFKYVSLEAKQTASGWMLQGVALTNAPAYIPMPEIKASTIVKGGSMEDILKLLDPQKFLEYMKETDEGKTLLMEFYNNNAEEFIEDEEVTASEEEDLEEDLEEEDEDVETEASCGEKSKKAKASKNKKAKASQDKETVASRLSSRFHKELQVLASGGYRFTTSQQRKALSAVMPIAYTEGVSSAVNKAVVFLYKMAGRPSAPSGFEVSASSLRVNSEFDRQTRKYLEGGR